MCSMSRDPTCCPQRSAGAQPSSTWEKDRGRLTRYGSSTTASYLHSSTSDRPVPADTYMSLPMRHTYTTCLNSCIRKAVVDEAGHTVHTCSKRQRTAQHTQQGLSNAKSVPQPTRHAHCGWQQSSPDRSTACTLCWQPRRRPGPLPHLRCRCSCTAAPSCACTRPRASRQRTPAAHPCG